MRTANATLVMLGVVGAVAAVGAGGCTGMSLGENRPGQDTPLDPWVPSSQDGGPAHATGAIAVEPDEDQVWVVHAEERGGETRSHLVAVDPVTGVSRQVLDVSDTTDRRIVFPADDRALLMAQQDGIEHLVLFDTAALAPIRWQTKPTWYWGTRRSPTGRFLVVADNAAPQAPLHVIDAATLDHIVVPHGGEAIEGMWNRASDRLLAVSVSGAFEENPVARVLRWTVSSIETWPEPDIDVELPGLDWDFAFSFTWIGVSPDDRFAVFPLVDRAAERHVLAVLDQTDGTVRLVPGRGPVGFTPDGSTIVSYGYDAEQGNLLYLIDPVTLATEVVPVPIEGLLSFFTTWDGNYVVCASVWGDERLVIYDPATGESTEVEGPGVSLDELVTRPGRHELWLAYARRLHRLRLEDDVLDEIPLAFEVSHMNILPIRDELVLSGPSGGTLWLFGLESISVDRTVELPLPFETTAASALDELFP